MGERNIKIASGVFFRLLTPQERNSTRACPWIWLSGTRIFADTCQLYRQTDIPRTRPLITLGSGQNNSVGGKSSNGLHICMQCYRIYAGETLIFIHQQLKSCRISFGDGMFVQIFKGFLKRQHIEFFDLPRCHPRWHAQDIHAHVLYSLWHGRPVTTSLFRGRPDTGSFEPPSSSPSFSLSFSTPEPWMNPRESPIKPIPSHNLASDRRQRQHPRPHFRDLTDTCT